MTTSKSKSRITIPACPRIRVRVDESIGEAVMRHGCNCEYCRTVRSEYLAAKKDGK